MADKLYGLHSSIQTLKDSDIEDKDRLIKGLEESYQKVALNLDPYNRQLIEQFEEKKKRYRDPVYAFKVRDKEISIQTHTESLSHTQIPKVALPKFKNWGDILRWSLQENVPGEFPFTAGIYHYKNTTIFIMKNTTYLLVLLLFAGCKSPREEQLPEPKETITIGKGEKVKLSQLIRSFEYITLEEKEIIGNIYNLKIQDKDIYIHDDISKSILKFDSTGSYQYKIHREGKGPGEYVMIVDFLVNNNKVEIFNTGNDKRIVFDENGAFITETKMNSDGENHTYLNESIILAYNTPSDLSEEAHYLYIWDDVITEILDKKLPFVPDKDKMLPDYILFQTIRIR